MRRTTPRRLVGATLAIGALIALPMPASVNADDCAKKLKTDKEGEFKKPPCPPPPPPPGS